MPSEAPLWHQLVLTALLANLWMTKQQAHVMIACRVSSMMSAKLFLAHSAHRASSTPMPLRYLRLRAWLVLLVNIKMTKVQPAVTHAHWTHLHSSKVGPGSVRPALLR
jgi:hypothetical protein